MKDTMDDNTLLFLNSNGDGLAMSYAYFLGQTPFYRETEPAIDVINRFGVVSKKYYKVKEGVWIDFDRAINTFTGSIPERVASAYKNVTYHMTDLTRIPACDFYDNEGYVWEIGPYDGAYKKQHWAKRIDDPEFRNIEYKPDTVHKGYVVSVDRNRNSVTIKFIKANEGSTSVDLQNSLISINGLFYNYEISGNNEIIVFGISDELYTTSVNFSGKTDAQIDAEIEVLNAKIKINEEEMKTLNSIIDSIVDEDALLVNIILLHSMNPQSEEYITAATRHNELSIALENHKARLKELENETVGLKLEVNNLVVDGKGMLYVVNVKVYTWEGVRKLNPVQPINRIGEWFNFSTSIDSNAIVIYKGQIIEHVVENKNNPKALKLKDVDPANLKYFDHRLLYVYPMKTSIPNAKLTKYCINGHKNRHKNTVEFVLPVSDAMVLYGGYDHDYEVQGEGSILYGMSVGSPAYLANDGIVKSVNFSLVGQEH